MNLTDTKTIFFDYDGTLHNTLAIYGPAFRKSYQYLIDTHGAEEKTWRDEDIKAFVGQPPSQMWKQFGHGLDQKGKKEASERLSNVMKEQIEQGNAVLYEGAKETLSYLRDKGYTLVFISNCKNYYLEAHEAMIDLRQYFTSMVCSETFKDIEQKTDVLGRIKDIYDGPQVIIGDRHHDIEAGKDHGLYTIAATYGFGSDDEYKQADTTIEDIRDLKKLF